MRFLPAIFANLFLFLSITGAGIVLRPFLPQTLSWSDRFATMILGGLGVLGTGIFLIGSVSFSLKVILAVLIPTALAGIYSIRIEITRVHGALQPATPPLLPVSVIALVLTVTLVGGLAEPVGDIKMDAIAYHLLGPRVWIRDAVIHVVPDECHTSFPATVETLYAALMAMGGTRAPGLFAVIAFGLLLLTSYGFAVRLGLDLREAWWATALIAAMPVVYRGSYGGFIDAIFSSFVLLALRFALDAESPGEFVLPGIFAGLAMGTKYTGIIAFILIVVSVSILAAIRQGPKLASFAGRLLLFATTAILIASPWYIRNWKMLGSPVYPPPPFLLRFFHIRYMSLDAIHALAALVHKEGLGMGQDFWSFVLLPFHFTFHPANFLNGPGGVGISLLALSPFGLLLRWRDRFVKILALFLFLQVAVWFVTEQEARFLIHAYVLFAIFAVWGWGWVAAKSPRIGPLLSGAAVACSILYGLAMIVPSRVADLHAVYSRTFENQRKFREIPYLESFTRLNVDPAVKKVLVLEPRVPTFYLQKNYLKPIGRFGEQTVPEANDAQQLYEKFTEYGITHILDVQLEDHGFRIPLGTPHLQLVFEGHGQRVYRVVLSQAS